MIEFDIEQIRTDLRLENMDLTEHQFNYVFELTLEKAKTEIELYHTDIPDIFYAILDIIESSLDIFQGKMCVPKKSFVFQVKINRKDKYYPIFVHPTKNAIIQYEISGKHIQEAIGLLNNKLGNDPDIKEYFILPE